MNVTEGFLTHTNLVIRMSDMIYKAAIPSTFLFFRGIPSLRFIPVYETMQVSVLNVKSSKLIKVFDYTCLIRTRNLLEAIKRASATESAGTKVLLLLIYDPPAFLNFLRLLLDQACSFMSLFLVRTLTIGVSSLSDPL